MPVVQAIPESEARQSSKVQAQPGNTSQPHLRGTKMKKQRQRPSCLFIPILCSHTGAGTGTERSPAVQSLKSCILLVKYPDHWTALLLRALPLRGLKIPPGLFIFKSSSSAGEMAQQQLFSLPEDLGSVPSTHMAAHNCLLLIPTGHLFWHPQA